MSNDLANNKVHGQHNSLSECASEAFAESSVCAISTILKTDSKSRKVIRIVVFVVFTLVFFYQCIAFLCYVLQHPTVVDYEIIRPERFMQPAYTFCNFNPIKRSKFCEKHPDNCTTPEEEFCDDNPRFCGTPDTKILKDDYLYLNDLEEFNHDFEDMTPYHSDEDSNPGGPFFRSRPSEFGNAACFSLYDRVDSSLDPEEKMRTPLGTGYADTLVLNPQENELIYPEAQSGIMFDLHSPFEAVNPFETGFLLKPGHLYRVRVKMTQEELPYDCVNYTEVWIENNKSGYRSKEACKHKCIGDTATKCLNCSAPYVLYPYPDLEVCKRNFLSSEEQSKLSEECQHPEDIIIGCINECKDECLKTKFSYEVKEIFLNSHAASYDKNESRTLKVLIEFPDADIQRIIHKRQFQVLEVFSLIGGLLAFWIGLSMVQVVDILECVEQIVIYLIKNRSKGSGKSPA